MPTEAANLPLGPPWPSAVQGILFGIARHRIVRYYRERYGPVFSVNLPVFGRAVVLCDPTLIKELFTTSTDLVGQVEPNLGRMFGPGSLFSTEGDDHKRQRKLLAPPFHGRRMKAYEDIVVDEVRRELATWPEGAPIGTLEPMNRITLNIILRAVFGADGRELDELRATLPGLVLSGSRLAAIPFPPETFGPVDIWKRFDRRRKRYDTIIDRLIEQARSSNLDERNDILAVMLQSRYDDGSALTNSEIADQLFTLLAAGHETTANTLAWTVERLRRHPALFARLQHEADTGGGELRAATILEVQRTRPVVTLTGRQVRSDSFTIGGWTLPRGTVIAVAIDAVHQSNDVFPNAAAFDPDRFVGNRPDNYSWVPFGGGVRRCIGASFASMEMDVTLRILLETLDFESTESAGERWKSRGITFAPADDGVAVVFRRDAQPASSGTVA